MTAVCGMRGGLLWVRGTLAGLLAGVALAGCGKPAAEPEAGGGQSVVPTAAPCPDLPPEDPR